MVDHFADGTGDRQWIHTDSARAANGPFGVPIAHGFLLPALVPTLLSEITEVHDMDLMLNSTLRDMSFDTAVTVGKFVQIGSELHATNQRKRLATSELRVTMTVSDRAASHPPVRVAGRAIQTLVVRSKRSRTTAGRQKTLPERGSGAQADR